MFLVNYAIGLALDDLPKALRAEPSAKDDKDDIERDQAKNNAILAALNQAKASRKGTANEDWRGVVL